MVKTAPVGAVLADARTAVTYIACGMRKVSFAVPAVIAVVSSLAANSKAIGAVMSPKAAPFGSSPALASIATSTTPPGPSVSDVAALISPVPPAPASTVSVFGLVATFQSMKLLAGEHVRKGHVAVGLDQAAGMSIEDLGEVLPGGAAVDRPEQPAKYRRPGVDRFGGRGADLDPGIVLESGGGELRGHRTIEDVSGFDLAKRWRRSRSVAA